VKWNVSIKVIGFICKGFNPSRNKYKKQEKTRRYRIKKQSNNKLNQIVLISG
jgi:hypothetical protein